MLDFKLNQLVACFKYNKSKVVHLVCFNQCKLFSYPRRVTVRGLLIMLFYRSTALLSISKNSSGNVQGIRFLLVLRGFLNKL